MNIIKILQNIIANLNYGFFYTPKIIDGGRSILFGKSSKEIQCFKPDEFDVKFKLLDEYRKKFDYGTGLISYESGCLFEEALYGEFRLNENFPLFSFNFFDKSSVTELQTPQINYEGVKDYLSSTNCEIKNIILNTSQKEYYDAVNRIRDYIKEGETYQVNYTIKINFDFEGDFINFILKLLFNQSADFISIVNNREYLIISFSPELFFEIEGENIRANPMKGTRKRGRNTKEDSIAKNELLNSNKDRAENVMIVDLLRNDLGKICHTNSVEVFDMFSVGKYESLFQMTSGVKGKLRTDSLTEIFRSIFPCGSITGAPKIRTMKIIQELEKNPRNIFTGAIGFFNRINASFNVPIRTIMINKITMKGEFGIGSGIVWDSEAVKEYNETLLKSNFIMKQDKYFEIFETALIEKGKIFLMDYHKSRIKNAADFFLFNFSETELDLQLLEKISTLNSSIDYRLKIRLDKWGCIKLELEEFKPYLVKENKLIISSKAVDSKDKFLYFKTTNRKLYDEELEYARSAGFFDCVFFNEDNLLTEGAITNIFIEKNKSLYTPPLECGLLNGCYRQYMLDSDPKISETKITKDFFLGADRIFAVNSLRKIINISSVYYRDKAVWAGQ